jgi:hypothetical protein
MARPKKLSDADALRLVDSLYEQCGDYRRLKFSELEKQAAFLGMNVKAYDLRRNNTVLRRIAEIVTLELNTDSIAAFAYKGLDVDGFISTNRTPAKLKSSLSELDGRWRKLYEYASSLSIQVSALSDNLCKSETLTNDLKSQNTGLSEQVDAANRQTIAFKAENSYLRKMIREYLYPPLADSVLNSEFAAFGANQAAIDIMTDGDTPASFSESVSADSALRSREEDLLDKLWMQAQGMDWQEKENWFE